MTLQGYSQCVDAYIEHIQLNAFRSNNVFDDMVALCGKTQAVIVKIFPNAQQVMSKLVLNLFHTKLQVSHS